MASDCYFHLTGGNGNTDPDASLGGVTSGNRLSSTALNNLFDNVNPDEIESAPLVEYRAIDIKNEGDAEAHNVQFYFTDTPNSESTVAFWYESSPGQSIVNETTEPVGASWSQPVYASRYALGDLAVSGLHRLWIRRTVDQSADNLNEDTATLHVWFS